MDLYALMTCMYCMEWVGYIIGYKFHMDIEKGLDTLADADFKYNARSR